MTPLLTTVTVPVRVPPAVGAKVTLMVQLAPAARIQSQVVVRAESPLALTGAMGSVLPLVLVRVRVRAVLVPPIFCALNVSVVRLRDVVNVLGPRFKPKYAM